MVNHGLFLSLFKLIPCPIHWIVYIWISYLNFNAVLALRKLAGSAQTHQSISFIWIVWSTLYVYLWRQHEFFFGQATAWTHAMKLTLNYIINEDYRLLFLKIFNTILVYWKVKCSYIKMILAYCFWTFSSYPSLFHFIR